MSEANLILRLKMKSVKVCMVIKDLGHSPNHIGVTPNVFLRLSNYRLDNVLDFNHIAGSQLGLLGSVFFSLGHRSLVLVLE
jgi:hypothetical protein